MINPPKTLKEARAYKYNNYDYWELECAYEIYECGFPIQCPRKNGKGPAGLYCWQHARKVK